MTTSQLQHLLVYLGYDTNGTEGIYGVMTEKAVREFQGHYGLPATGQADDKTQKALKDSVAYDKFRPPDIQTGTFWDGIKYFKREEFRCPCGKWCNGYPVEPTYELVKLMDELREVFGRPIIVVPPDGHSGGSGVRCEQYNASLSSSGSVSNSRHLRGKAADWKCPGVVAAIIEAELERRKKAGQIRYWYRISSGSWHVDVN